MRADGAGPTLFKGHALGNDYLVAEARALPFALAPASVRLLCDRRRGVGADGLVALLGPAADGRIDAQVWNADGSTAEVSGNGLRIAALALRARGAAGERVELRSAGRVYAVRFRDDGLVAIELGAARFGAVREPVVVGGRSVAVTELEVGNPHAVVEASEVDESAWPALAAALEVHPRYPARTNVERLRRLGDGAIDIDIHERGVGPTAASGTGACAAASAAVRLGLVLAAGPVRVAMPGGAVLVEVGAGRLVLAGAVSAVGEIALAPELVERVGAGVK